MTQPPTDPASEGEPEGRPQGDPRRHGRPGPYGGQPYGEQPYGEQQPYGPQPGYGTVPGHGGAVGGYGGHAGPAQALASRWARLGAALVDLILIGLVTGILSLAFVDWDRAFNEERRDTMYDPAQVGSNAIGVVLGFLYYWLMHARWGQTLGKKLLGIRVVREDNGQAITIGQAAGRSAFYSVLGGICGCIGLIDAAWILWDRRKQALHCKVARTVVVKAGPHVPDPYSAR